METKPTTSLYGGTDTERGVGGKLRKPPPRKSQATPYDRPSSTLQGRRWWLSKLVDPAYRLVANGATRVLPAFFSTTPSVDALPPPPPPSENLGKPLPPTTIITIDTLPLFFFPKESLTCCTRFSIWFLFVIVF